MYPSQPAARRRGPGVGGAGSNAVDRLKMENLERLQLAVINTDYIGIQRGLDNRWP